jgi:hypothetical protein
MLKVLTACTSEIDDVEAAVSEIREQLNGDCLLTNSVGTLTCRAEFVESGVVKALCEALPFETVGVTTLGNCVSGCSGTMLLTLMVLTSDDISFAVGLTDPFSSEDEEALRKGYRSALTKLEHESSLESSFESSLKPSLMLSFAPFLLNVGADFYVETFSAISGGVPNFGTLAFQRDADFHESSRVICNGTAYRDRYAMVLLAGDVHPKFFTGSIAAEEISREKGLVTASVGNQLQTIDGKPAIDYLCDMGVARNDDGIIAGIETFQFIIDYNDGTMPVVRVILDRTPEGYAIFSGNIPVGATVSIGFMGAEGVIATVAKALSSALTTPDIRGILMFSCAGRYFALGYEPMREMEKVQEIMEGTGIPYQLTYSGGELCPVQEKEMRDGSTTNRCHNDTFIVCVL